jgi:hypothetical protein
MEFFVVQAFHVLIYFKVASYAVVGHIACVECHKPKRLSGQLEQDNDVLVALLRV